LLILGVALIVVGPSKLPELAKGLAKGLKEFQKATDEVKSTINEHEGLKEIKELKDSVQETVQSLNPKGLLDLDAKDAKPVAPVVQVKKFEPPAAEQGPEVTPVIEPKKPEEDLAGRLGLVDAIAAEHQETPTPEAALQTPVPFPATTDGGPGKNAAPKADA
jgi:TatA/E family protein of Tat protein translocase